MLIKPKPALIAGVLSGLLVADIVDFIHSSSAAGNQPPVRSDATPEEKSKKSFAVRFRKAEWKDVIAWYAKISGLKLVGDTLPPGPVTLEPPRNQKFTIEELTDVLNEAMTWHDLTLVRGQGSFTILSTNKDIPTAAVPRIDLQDLPRRGKTELIQLELPIPFGLDPSDAVTEIGKMTSPFGRVSEVKGKRLLVVDTSINAIRIAGLLGPRLDLKRDPLIPQSRKVRFQRAHWDDVIDWYCQITGLTPFLTVAPKGHLTFIPQSDEKEFTVAEITDILNAELARQKLWIIRRHRTFVVDRMDQRLALQWVPQIELGELHNYGTSELVQVLIPLKKGVMTRIGPDMEKVLTPMWPRTLFTKTNTVAILDNAGSVRSVYESIRKAKSARDDD
jgi:hypothetical protein